MTRALFKKQMMEVFSWLYQNKKSGKNRSKAGILGFGLLYLLIFVMLGAMFWFFASTLCAPLLEAGFGWLYMALMGLVAVFLGVFGSVFNTYASLYMAKDNDLLLSMPVPTGRILMIRLSGVFAIGLMYELIVMIPTLIVWFMTARPGAAGVIFSLLIPLVLAFFVLTLSCILGWVVALISGKLRRKNLIVVFLSLAFLAAYYYFYAQAYSMLAAILANPAGVGAGIRRALYPLYQMGLAAGGNVLSMVVFTAIVAALFGLVFLVLQRSFLKLATANRGAAKAKYREKAAKSGSVRSALLRRELRRFLGSSVYMLNCGLGVVLMPAAAVAVVLKGETVMEVLTALFGGRSDLVPLLAAAAICMITTMNDMTAPSVSLEGKTLWLIRSLPVPAWDALRAKVELHLLLTLIPAALLTACVEYVIRPTAVFAVLIPVVVALFAVMMALAGLVLNLKIPNLTWTSEAVPVKQGMSVMLALFGGWAVVIALGALCWFGLRFLSPAACMAAAAVLMAAVSFLLYRWLRTRGARIFETL